MRGHGLRRLAAIALIVTMGPVSYAGVACAGWSSAAADRMACCKRPGNACPSLSPDDCCADGEQRQNLEQVAAVLITPGRTVSHPLPAAALQPCVFVPDPVSLSNRPHTYLLDSVFRI